MFFTLPGGWVLHGVRICSWIIYKYLVSLNNVDNLKHDFNSYYSNILACLSSL